MEANRRIWLFNSAGGFYGNVKFLYLYICNHRDDINAIYIDDNSSVVDSIKKLGYKAVKFGSKEANNLIAKCEVYVNEQCKELYQSGFINSKILNLYHGVGLKEIERKWKREFLGKNMAKKYITYNNLYRNNMCFLVTSPFMEHHFKEQIDLSDEQIIRAGYPRNLYQKQFGEKNLKDELNLNDKKLAIYAPTYREKSPYELLPQALPDLSRLNNVLNKENIVLFIKLHQKINRDHVASNLQKNPKQFSNIKIWDPSEDLYEYISSFDLAIVDYSSIYYDFLEAGIKHFIRYIYDYEDEKDNLIYDYFNNTSGKVCLCFDEFLDSLGNNVFEEDKSKTKLIKEKFWSYSSPDSFEAIIQQVDNYQIKNIIWPTLYSFDIFDTIIHRKVSNPGAIFIDVQEKIRKLDCDYPSIFYFDYPRIRKQAEANEREFIRKTIGHYEIEFEKIFNRIKSIYHLNDRQVTLLKNLELDSELNNVEIDIDVYLQIRNLLDCNNKVIFISDMYLPKAFVSKLITKVAPDLKDIPIYISSERKIQKSTGLLYLDIYREFSPWRFGHWKHIGDNKIADGTRAREYGIEVSLKNYPGLSGFERALTDRLNITDIFKIANIFRKIRIQENLDEKGYFSLTIASLIFVPYLKWCITDAISRGIKTLYFITRDGNTLKPIADKIIEANKYNIKTSLIYGSRKAWRLSAIQDPIDEEFFSDYGNFIGIDTADKFYASLSTTQDEFYQRLPFIEIPEHITGDDNKRIRNQLESSEIAKKFIIEKAVKNRKLVVGYFSKNINFIEDFAFVEFWGRGYTQTCMTNIIKSIDPDFKSTYYYYRSILPSDTENCRINYVEENASLLFVEAIFANINMRSVEGYASVNDEIIPIFKPQQCDFDLISKIRYLTHKFIDELSGINFKDETSSLRMASTFAVRWLNNNPTNPIVYKAIAHLLDSVETWGELREFAPKLTKESYIALAGMMQEGKPTHMITRSVPMSLARSDKAIQILFNKEIAKNKSENKPKEVSNKKRLIIKLTSDPVAYCKDSKKSYIRWLGKVINKNKLLQKWTVKFLTYYINRSSK